MKKQALAIALATALGTVVGTAYAQVPPIVPPGPGGPAAPIVGPVGQPLLNADEMIGICLLESLVSIVATNVAHQAICEDAVGAYKASVTTIGGSGTASVEGVNLRGSLTTGDPKGYRCLISQVGGGTIGWTTPYLSQVTGYTGNHSYRRDKKIFLDSAGLDGNFRFDGVPYDEHSIKDFYRCVVNPGATTCPTNSPNALDYGLEVITKYNYPRHKWWEQSYYKRENGSPDSGWMWIRKTQLAAGVGCRITANLRGYNYNGLEYAGTIFVSN